MQPPRRRRQEPAWQGQHSASTERRQYRGANTGDVHGLEAAVVQAIAACGGDMRSAIRALIVANDYLETEVGELMKAVSHAYVRGRFHTYSG
jgi:stage V sporulation protein SpoVS